MQAPLPTPKRYVVFSFVHSNLAIIQHRLQYARNIYETEPAIAWSFTIGLAGVLIAHIHPSSRPLPLLYSVFAGPALVVISPFTKSDPIHRQ